MGEPTMRDLSDRLSRIEHMLSVLIEALAEEEDAQEFALDGSSMGRERDANQPL